jgi:PAS domain-containing protein
MHINTSAAERMVRVAGRAIQEDDRDVLQSLREFPAAIYATDARGMVIHFNRACIPFAGRTPRLGQDAWCVTWKLYTEAGEFLPHGQCPMALAIRERRSIRGMAAVAERPDGTHVNFQPFPTPLFDRGGRLVGAVNLLLDVTGRERAFALRAKAARCRRLVNLMPDRRSLKILNAMAAEYDREAFGIEQAVRRPG